MPEIAGSDGTALYYEEEGAGEPVVLLHGLGSSIGGNWQQPGVWAALVEAGHRVVGLDARGHGRSGKPHVPAAYEDDAMVKDVASLLDHLGVERVDLAGYSMGASTALRFAAAAGGSDRLRRLVLGGIGGDPRTWGVPDGRGPTRPQRWLAGLEATDPEAIDDPMAKRAREVFAARGNDLAAIAALLRSGRRHLSNDIPLDRVTVPTLVLCGDRDAAPNPLAAALPTGNPVVLDGDHESVLGNPMFAKVVVAFLMA